MTEQELISMSESGIARVEVLEAILNIKLSNLDLPTRDREILSAMKVNINESKAWLRQILNEGHMRRLLVG